MLHNLSVITFAWYKEYIIWQISFRYSVHFVLKLNRIHYIVIHFFSNFFSSIQRICEIIWQISFSKFSDVLLAFTCASAIDDLWSICLGVNILIPFPCVSFPVGNIFLSKTLRFFCFSLISLSAFMSQYFFFFLITFFRLVFQWELSHFLRCICSSNASFSVQRYEFLFRKISLF